MLVLSRRLAESLIINESVWLTDDIQVVAIRFEGDKVRLGVEGAPGATFHRGEFWNLPG